MAMVLLIFHATQFASLKIGIAEPIHVTEMNHGMIGYFLKLKKKKELQFNYYSLWK